jgi:hypothetical protein
MPGDLARQYPAADVAAIINAAVRGTGRRHPAEVVSDRLGNIVTKYGDRLTGAELDAVAMVRQALEEIAEGKRRPNV